MRIAVFGGSGFIGVHLIQFLKGYYDIIDISLRKPISENTVLNSDILINLIGKAHDHSGIAKDDDYFYANFELAKEVFNFFLSSSAKLYIHISSLAALEEIESETSLTEIDKCNPISIYGKSKRAAEEWLLQQDLPSDKKLIIIRPPMVHGPGDKGNLGLLYKLVSKGIPYPLASFNNQRSFISLDNFCFFVEQIIEKHDKMDSGIYHISDDESVSTKDIIRIIKDITNSKAPNVALPKLLVILLARIGDMVPIPLNTKRLKKMTSNLLVSNQKTKNVLEITKLPYSAEEGLEKTIRSFKNA